MHHTFTGNSRRPRQVNLSGRPPPNAWATSSASGSLNALATAQQERERRQRERDRLEASKTIQRRWRGYNSRKLNKQNWRSEWDHLESFPGKPATTYASESQSLVQLNLLRQFFNASSTEDVERLKLYLYRQALTLGSNTQLSPEGPWPLAYLRMQKLIMAVVERDLVLADPSIDPYFLTSLASNLVLIPHMTEGTAQSLYRLLAQVVRRFARGGLPDIDLGLIFQCANASLLSKSSSTMMAYRGLVCEFLILPELSKSPIAPHSLDALAEGVNYKVMSKVIVDLLETPKSHKYTGFLDQDNRAFILAHLIYFYRRAHRYRMNNVATKDKDYIFAVSCLLSSVAVDNSARHNQRDDYDPGDDAMDSESGSAGDPFVQEQVLSLVDGDSISDLLGNSNESTSITNDGRLAEDAKHLASFALTLMRFFPHKADDIRMQLYRGSAANSPADPKARIPAILYFWQAAKATSVFKEISSNLDSTIVLLKPGTRQSNTGYSPNSSRSSTEAIQDDWRIILVFFELYTFVLRVMDDEEFFSPHSIRSSTSTSNWASQNALPLQDVEELTNFLKNLGFSMYYNAFALSNYEPQRPRHSGNLANYFSVAAVPHSPEKPANQERLPEATVAGIAGVAIEYVKGVVTGLLRMLYERDSRRPFLPKGHWLMTSRLDMDGFISSVVEEDEKRHQMQEDEENDSHDEMDDDHRDNVIGASHTNRLRQQEKLRRQQRKLARNRFLASVAPRLEIMQNMPFFIPFETRVQIFREFIGLDKVKRRGGNGDAESWRFQTMHRPEMAARHHARIRRNHVFEDAYEHFETLGDGLKEPIQITFADAFDNNEAGIDGGGVTKEFLTSITQESFTPDQGLQMFVENDQHMLYPNPSAVEELKASFGPHRVDERRSAISKLLKKYEFLGRIIGKCLYEGILVDVSFAGFFLLKWALTSGDGTASRESSYRANLNDLRDMDEGLYQGLLKLKNDPGDVSEYGIDFTTNEEITTDYRSGTKKVVTVDLRPNGSNELVTNANRLLYISFVARHRLQVQPFRQTSAFLRGLSAMIKPSWLNMFNQSELQILIGGTSSSIDIADLRRNTVCSGVFQPGTIGEHSTIQMFWEVMTEFSDSERRAVLKFVTSTPRAPLLGFKSLDPRFTIRDSGRDEMRLPSASTCVNLLKLPMYSNKSILKAKLLQAALSGAGFDLS